MATQAPNDYKDPYWASLSSSVEQKLDLPSGLLNNIVTRGERSNADQVSEAKAQTVYQITPTNRKLVLDKYGIDAYLNPENAAEAAGLLLKESLDRNQGDVATAVSEYHGGTDRANWGPRTRAYVGRVMSAQRQQPQQQPQSTFQRVQAAQQPAIPPNAIAQVYEAYKGGQMTPEEAAEFEADVKSGVVMLPRGATLAGQESRAPTEAPAAVMLPPEVTDAYQTGKMSEQERADLEADLQAGLVQLSASPTTLPTFEEGVMVQEQPGIIQRQPEPTLGQQIVGAGETALATATGATGGALGMAGGTLEGLTEQILSGQFGTQEAADLVEQAAMKRAQQFTFEPRTQTGQQQLQALGELTAPLVAATPFTAELGAITQGARAAAPAVRSAAQPIVQAGQKAAQPIQVAAQRVVEAARGVLPGAEARGVSAGAAATPEAMQRVETAAQLPVPFKGKAALTEGQASRDFAQLQFEKEIAKDPELGAAVRERVENQTGTMIQNFDAMIDRLEPVATSKRELGMAVDQPLINRVETKRREIRKLYDEAEKAGELENPVSLDQLAGRMADLDRYSGIVPIIESVKREAMRLGALVEGPDGQLTAGRIALKDSELLRQFVNDATDWMDRRQALFAKRINGAIDEATEGQGGNLYRKARKARAEFAEEFENVGLTSKLLGTKRGTDERQIALEDVFDKVIISSKVDEMNKLRSTLLKSGKEGKQAWADLKAAGIERIKSASLSPSQRDSQGNPLLSPDKLQRTVRNMDETGKLESLYGKKQAQTMRDLADLATVIYTAPPGAINTSNTASALMVALDSLGTFAVTGVPAPVATALKQASKYMRDQKVKARINQALSAHQKEI